MPSLNIDNIGAKEKIIMNGMVSDVEIIWFLERIPTHAPAMMEIRNPMHVIRRKKPLSEEGNPTDMTKAPIMQIAKTYVPIPIRYCHGFTSAIIRTLRVFFSFSSAIMFAVVTKGAIPIYITAKSFVKKNSGMSAMLMAFSMIIVISGNKIN